MLQSNDQMLLTKRTDFSFRKTLLAAPRRSHSRSASFPEAIVACMVEDRRPSQREIETVAARIWKECRRSDGPLWQDIPPDSRLSKSMIAAARAALGAADGLRP